MRAQVTNGRTTRRWEGGAGDWPGEWQQLDGHGGGNIHFGGFGAGGGGVGCNTYRNKLIGEVCPNIGSGCHVGFCQDPGQARRVYSCFDSCTHHQCDDLVNLLWQDGVEWASCEWHGGVQPDFPPTVALFTHFPCPSAAGSAFQDCMCAGFCLADCIKLVGGETCYEYYCDVPPKEPRPIITFDDCSVEQMQAVEDSVRRICLHLRLTLPPGCEHPCLSDYRFKDCLREICAGTRHVNVICAGDDAGWCDGKQARTWRGFIWLCQSFFVHTERFFDSNLFHELLHWCQPGLEWEFGWSAVERRQERCYPDTTGLGPE